MRIEITYDGGLMSIGDIMRSNIEEILCAGAQRVCESAKEQCPVDTGALRNSIKTVSSEGRAQVRADADYAAYVEFGTSKMAPQPYLVPALIENSASVLEAMAQKIADI
jgi:HK97 gp10 family phage protein